MLYALYLGLCIPLVGFLTLLVSWPWLPRRAAGPLACLTLATSALCFASLFVTYLQGQWTEIHTTAFTWIDVAGFEAHFGLHLDTLSLLMTLIISGIGLLIHVYSLGYMDGEEGTVRYFACLNFFVFMMLLLVLADNLLLLFVGWEGVGLASYLLIGYWYERTSAAQAATKAFIVNRIGDFAFLLGLLLALHLFGSTDIMALNTQVGESFTRDAPILILLALLLFIGATGKSAQLPLYNWLPDAMEGPTPVSALIHAATMVTAGVYLIVRLHPLFEMVPTVSLVVATVGAVTSLFAALCAVGQIDLKRVLAYSTVSQLGLMFLACGVGAYYAAMFHLMAHAFIKALLFLSAGNVVHGMHGATDMNQMGGLSRFFPKTRWLFLIGVLALSGLPPLAAFFSKDLILEETHLSGFTTLFVVGMAASLLTAFYLMRAYCLTFHGTQHFSANTADTVHEAPRVMIWPLAILALLSIFGGWLGFNSGYSAPLQRFLTTAGVDSDSHGLLSLTSLLATAGALLAIATAVFVYTRYADRLGPTPTLLTRSFFVDDLYTKAIAEPLRGIARWLAQVVEPTVFEGSVSLTARTAQSLGFALQQIQSGQIRLYVAWMTLGAIFLIAYLAL